MAQSTILYANAEWRIVVRRGPHGRAEQLLLEYSDGVDALGITRWRFSYTPPRPTEGVQQIELPIVLELLRRLNPSLLSPPEEGSNAH